MYACIPVCHTLCVFVHIRVFLIRLKQQVQDKEMLERELYSRFVMVMNEKKAKIRGLQDAVRQLQQTNDQQRDEQKRQRFADLLFSLAHLSFCFKMQE